MTILMVFMMVTFVYSVAAGVGVYMVTTTVFGLAQAIYQNKALIQAKIQTYFNKGQGVVVEKKG